MPEDLIADTLLGIRQEFGVVSSETQPIYGIWEHHSLTYQDHLRRIFVDVEDLPENRAFFVAYKEKLKERFQQIDIWITTFSIEVI